jgi:hypothetical protein
VLFSNYVFFLQENYFRLVNRRFLSVIQAETHYRQAVAWPFQVSGRAIQLNRTCIPIPVNDITFESFTVRQVAHQNSFILLETD